MNFKFNCPVCNRGQHFEGLCLKCKEAKRLEEARNLTPEQIQERQQYLIEHLEDLEDQEDMAMNYFWDCLSNSLYHDDIFLKHILQFLLHIFFWFGEDLFFPLKAHSKLTKGHDCYYLAGLPTPLGKAKAQSFLWLRYLQ